MEHTDYPSNRASSSSSSATSETVPLIRQSQKNARWSPAYPRTSVPAVAGLDAFFGLAPVGFRRPKPSARSLWRFVRVFSAMLVCLLVFNLGLYFLWDALARLGWMETDVGWLPGFFDDLSGVPVSNWELRRCFQPAEWSTPRFTNQTALAELDADVENYDLISKASFDLPLSAENIFLAARGSLGTGSVRFVVSDEESTSIRVDVHAYYDTEKGFMRTKVCRLGTRERQGTSRIAGVGISSRRFRRPWTPADSVHIALTVRIPREAYIPSFSTVLPTFEHDFADLAGGRITFGSLNVRAVDAHVQAESIKAERAAIRTTDAPISGHFAVTRSLKIYTTNAPITVDVHLNSNGVDTPVLDLGTTNGPIDATVQLYSPSSEPRHVPRYRVNAATSRTRLNLRTLLSSPSDSEQQVSDSSTPWKRRVHLDLDASTFGAPARVWLPEGYEGTFEVNSEEVRPAVFVNGDDGDDEDADEEEDRDREKTSDENAPGGTKRAVEFSAWDDRRIRGSVRWFGSGVNGDPDRGGGRVFVRSRGAPAVLYL